MPGPLMSLVYHPHFSLASPSSIANETQLCGNHSIEVSTPETDQDFDHSSERLSPVRPLRTLGRRPRQDNIYPSPPKPRAPVVTMAEARELFEEYGIDRPAG